MPSWNCIRIFVLILIFSTSVSVLSKKVIFTSSSSELSVNSEPNLNEPALPVAIPIQDWESISSSKLNDQHSVSLGYQAGKEYRYRQGAVLLKSQARYIIQTDGDIERFISNDSSLSHLTQESWKARYSEETGSYFLISTSNSMHLSSCINPHGMSTVSTQDYKWNRNFQDIRYRLLAWLLGGKLKDERCLWTHMSIFSKKLESKDLTLLLEESWKSWYQWWSIKLPKM